MVNWRFLFQLSIWLFDIAVNVWQSSQKHCSPPWVHWQYWQYIVCVTLMGFGHYRLATLTPTLECGDWTGYMEQVSKKYNLSHRCFPWTLFWCIFFFFKWIQCLKEVRSTIKMVDMYTNHIEVLPYDVFSYSYKTLNPFGCMPFCC